MATSAEGTHLSYLWTRNGIPLNVDRDRLYYANDTGTLVIDDTELGDTGEYQCTVQTILSSILSPAPNVSSSLSMVAVYRKPIDTYIFVLSPLINEVFLSLAGNSCNVSLK